MNITANLCTKTLKSIFVFFFCKFVGSLKPKMSFIFFERMNFMWNSPLNDIGKLFYEYLIRHKISRSAFNKCQYLLSVEWIIKFAIFVAFFCSISLLTIFLIFLLVIECMYNIPIFCSLQIDYIYLYALHIVNNFETRLKQISLSLFVFVYFTLERCGCVLYLCLSIISFIYFVT